MKPIFISYSRRDDTPFRAGGNGWVSSFRSALEADLKHVGCSVDTWMDTREIPGNRIFDTSITEALESCQVLVIVLSDNWVSSKYCNHELKRFAARFPDGLSDRVFVVKKGDVPVSIRPNDLQRLNGYRFHQSQNERNPRALMELPISDDPESEFRQELRTLSLEIREKIRTPDAKQPKTTIGSKRLVLARATPDLLSFSDRLYRELKAHGHDVVEPANYHGTAAEIREEWLRIISGVDATIHLVGSTADPVAHEEATLAELQFNLSAGLTNRLRLTWISPSALLDDAQNLKAARSIRDVEREKGDRLFQGVEAEAMSEVIAVLKERNRSEEEPVVYLIYSREDEEPANRLAEYFHDHSIIFEPSILEGDATKIMEAHLENLQNAKSALVYWGSSDDLWFRQKIRELRKYLAHASEVGMARVGCLGDPDKMQKRTVVTAVRHELDAVYFAFSGNNFSVLEPYVRHLKTELQ